MRNRNNTNAYTARLIYFLFIIIILGSLIAIVWGFYSLNGIAGLPPPRVVLRTVVFLLAGLTCIELTARFININQYAAAGIVICFIALVTGTIWPVLVTTWFALSSYALGIIVTSILRIEKQRLSPIFLMLIGAGTYGSIVSILAHFPINYPGIYGFGLLVPIFIVKNDVFQAIMSIFDAVKIRSKMRMLDLALTSVALLHFIVALMPEVGHDALVTHLFVPGHLYARHGWAFDVDKYVWAVMPMMGDWLYSIGYMLAGETASRFINVGFIFLLSCLARDLVIWAKGSAEGAKWAALLFLTTPLTYTESSTLYIESVWAAFVVAGTFSVLKIIQSERKNADQIIIAGFMLGCALAAKAVTFTFLPGLFLVLILRYKTWLQNNWVSALALGLTVFIIVGGIPYFRAWYITNNPVFPFFNHIFQSNFWPSVAFQPPPNFEKGITWDFLYRVIVETGTFHEGKPGSAGFHWLLIIPSILMLALARNYRGLILFIIASISIVLTFQNTAYMRYVFPSILLILAGISAALSSNTNEPLIKAAVSMSFISILVVNIIFFKSATSYGDISLNAILSESGRNTYLNSPNRLPIRNAIQIVNKLNRYGRPVAVFSLPLTGGLASDALYPNWYNYKFQKMVNISNTPKEMANMLVERDVVYVILDSKWGTAEKRKVIENITTSLSHVGGVSVRKIKNNYRFTRELLKNSKFTIENGWMFSSEVINQSTNNIAVNSSSYGYQSVSIISHQLYQKKISIRCRDLNSFGRMQINWLDEESKIIKTDIRVIGCTNTLTKHIMQVRAPDNAVLARVFAIGHTERRIIIKSISFMY